MLNCCHSHAGRPHVHARKQSRMRTVDPTHTLTIRRAFEADMVRRFKLIRRSIIETIVANDAFGLRVNEPGKQFAFAFPRSADKVDAFMRWLRSEQNAALFDVQEGTPILSSGSRAWASTYIDSAYQRGMRHAGNELRGAGATVSDRWIDAGFFRPAHADRAGLIYTRTYSELRGITDAMDQQISRVLAQGIIEGRGAQYIAREIVDRVDHIGITRARVLARTEIVAAHSEATLNTFREAGIAGVTVNAEFSTSRDNAVCAECAALEGRTFRIEEADGMIPLHPNCRCAWIPIVENASGVVLQ